MIKLRYPIFISVGKNILMDVIFSNIVTGANYRFHCALLRLEPENPIYEYSQCELPRIAWTTSAGRVSDPPLLWR